MKAYINKKTYPLITVAVDECLAEDGQTVYHAKMVMGERRETHIETFKFHLRDTEARRAAIATLLDSVTHMLSKGLFPEHTLISDRVEGPDGRVVLENFRYPDEETEG